MPILDINGGVLAVVSVSERYPSVWQLLSGAGERLLVYLGLGAALGMLASWLLSRRIKRQTRGLEIAEIASLAEHREALLHSIREGVVAVNNDGVITVLNDSAQELLDVTPEAVGRRADDVGLDPAVTEFLLSGEEPAATSSSSPAPGCSRSTGVAASRAANRSAPSPPCATAPSSRRCRANCRRTRASPTPCGPRPTNSPTNCTPSPVWCSSASTTRCTTSWGP